MKKINFINWRLFVICFCLVGAIFAVVYKVILVQVEDSLFLQNEGKKRYIKYKEINPVRGAIYDRNKFPLAVSIINYDLYALKGLNIDKFFKIKDLVEIDEDISITEPFKRKTLLKKGLTAEEQSIIEDLNFNELEIEIRHSRHYLPMCLCSTQWRLTYRHAQRGPAPTDPRRH